MEEEPKFDAAELKIVDDTGSATPEEVNRSEQIVKEILASPFRERYTKAVSAHIVEDDLHKKKVVVAFEHDPSQVDNKRGSAGYTSQYL